MNGFDKAVEIYCAIVWWLVPVVWITIAIIAIWNPDLLVHIPVGKIFLTHGLLLIVSGFFAAIIQ